MNLPFPMGTCLDEFIELLEKGSHADAIATCGK